MVWLLVAVGAATAAVLLIIVVILLRHLRGLATSLQELQADLVPVLEDIQRGSESAQRTLAQLERRAASIRPDRD